jgi:hypothetical protein
MKTGRIQTVVFEVTDPKAAEALFEAFKNNTSIFGLRPFAMGIGDQMTKPTEIAEALCDIDPDMPDRSALRELVELADSYNADIAASIKV